MDHLDDDIRRPGESPRTVGDPAPPSPGPDHRAPTPLTGGRGRRGSARPDGKGGDAGRCVLGIDMDGEEPTEARERAVYRAGRRLRKAEAEAEEARDGLRQATDALRAERDRQRDVERLQTAAMMEEAGIDGGLLRELAAAKKAGDTVRAREILAQLAA